MSIDNYDIETNKIKYTLNNRYKGSLLTKAGSIVPPFWNINKKYIRNFFESNSDKPDKEFIDTMNIYRFNKEEELLKK